MTQYHTGQCLHLDIQHRIALGLGEVADLFLSKFDVGQFAGRQLGDQIGNLGLCQAKCGWGIAIKLF